MHHPVTPDCPSAVRHAVASFSSPAQPPGANHCFLTPAGGPQGDPLGMVEPFLFDTPQPHTLEFRSAVKLKEKRKQRQLACSPYARRASSLLNRAGGATSVPARRKVLLEEEQRLKGLPLGQVCSRIQIFLTLSMSRSENRRSPSSSLLCSVRVLAVFAA